MRQTVLTTLKVSFTVLAIPGALIGQDTNVEPRGSMESIDLSVPTGYVEICSLNRSLCNALTKGYPSSVRTIGYFVTREEWQRYEQDSLNGFTNYLIAQLSDKNSPTDLARIKGYVHSQQGNLPDLGRLPAMLESQGRANLGVFDESDSSISFGTVLRLQSRVQGSGLPIDLVATNSAVVVSGRVLSLYVYRQFRQEYDIQAAENLTREWLRRLIHRSN